MRSAASASRDGRTIPRALSPLIPALAVYLAPVAHRWPAVAPGALVQRGGVKRGARANRSTRKWLQHQAATAAAQQRAFQMHMREVARRRNGVEIGAAKKAAKEAGKVNADLLPFQEEQVVLGRPNAKADEYKTVMSELSDEEDIRNLRDRLRAAQIMVLYAGSFKEAARVVGDDLVKAIRARPEFADTKFTEEVCAATRRLHLEFAAAELSEESLEKLRDLRSNLTLVINSNTFPLAAGALELVHEIVQIADSRGIRNAIQRIAHPIEIDTRQSDGDGDSEMSLVAKRVEGAYTSAGGRDRNRDDSQSSSKKASLEKRIAEAASQLASVDPVFITAPAVKDALGAKIVKQASAIPKVEGAFSDLLQALERACLRLARAVKVSEEEFEGVPNECAQFWLANLRWEQRVWADGVLAVDKIESAVNKGLDSGGSQPKKDGSVGVDSYAAAYRDHQIVKESRERQPDKAATKYPAFALLENYQPVFDKAPERYTEDRRSYY